VGSSQSLKDSFSDAEILGAIERKRVSKDVQKRNRSPPVKKEILTYEHHREGDYLSGRKALLRKSCGGGVNISPDEEPRVGPKRIPSAQENCS